MAHTTKGTTSKQDVAMGQACIPGVGSPISNTAYDIVSALHAKLEGLEAYRKYANDGNEEIWKKLCAQELQGVQLLVDELERLVRAGELRLKEPGRGNA